MATELEYIDYAKKRLNWNAGLDIEYVDEQRESAEGKQETEGQPPAVAGRPFDAAKG